MRLSLFRKQRNAAVQATALQILSGYVLHMSITSLGDGDIKPLYEEYVSDPRLGAPEREELTSAFHMLRGRRLAET